MYEERRGEERAGYEENADSIEQPEPPLPCSDIYSDNGIVGGEGHNEESGWVAMLLATSLPYVY